MATSGSYDFIVSRDDIIKYALRKIRSLKKGFTISPQDLSDASFALNLIAKQWQERSDGATNLKMWLRKPLTLFLQSAQAVYTIGPTSTDHAALDSDTVLTTMTVGASSGASSITVADATGILDTENIGVVLDTGVVQWTTVSGAPAGNVITLATTLNADAASGQRVYNYSTLAQPPTRFLSHYLRNSNGDDIPLFSLLMEEYESLPDKDPSGTPTSFYHQRDLSLATLHFDAAIQDVTDTFQGVAHYPIQDFDAAADNPDFPQVWYRALGYMLAIDLAPEYGVELSQNFMAIASDAIVMAQNADPETSLLFFEPERF